MIRTPVVLVILDGWGIAPEGPGNAITAAHTPNMDHYLAEFPSTRLRCFGEDVGLPEGQMGNSEVGHLNIGAGRVVYQSITRIDRAIRDRTFHKNPTLIQAIEYARERRGRLHLIGLVGDGGVHAHHRHWQGVLDICKQHQFDEVIVHAIMDGRDTEPTSGHDFLYTLAHDMEERCGGVIGSVSGRYYAMDRDRRWDRTRLAWNAIVHAVAPAVRDPISAIRDSYESGVTDEFIEPVVVEGTDSRIRCGDSILFLNFRADRVRQFLTALTSEDFQEFDRGTVPDPLFIGTLTEYDPGYSVEVAFPPETVKTPLARVVSDANIAQYHTAETEKYAHVTYFINGGREEPFPGEERHMVPSPDVATYDLQPEMSAPEVTRTVCDAIRSGRFGLVVINYANGDMVGHTGDFDAAVSAIETVDQCLGDVVSATLAAEGHLIATADHGNAEEMLIPGTDDVWTAHTLNPVPFVLVVSDNNPLRKASLKSEGILADIAPTVLELMGLEKPDEMTGRSLVVHGS